MILWGVDSLKLVDKRARATRDLKVTFRVRFGSTTAKGFNDVYLEAKARIWPCLSYMCHIRSIKAGS